MAIVEIVAHVAHVLSGILLKVISPGELMRFIYLEVGVKGSRGKLVSMQTNPKTIRGGPGFDSGIEKTVFVGDGNV